MDDRIARRVEAFRKLNKWSQKELAKRAGLSVTTVNHIEKGSNTDLAILQKIEAVLNVRLY